MNTILPGSDSPHSLKPALDQYAQTTGLTVQLFGADGEPALGSSPIGLAALFKENGYEPGLFAECAARCLKPAFSGSGRAVVAGGQNGLTVIGAPLVLEGAVVGAAVAGYALAGFCHVSTVQRWARSARLPFYRLWEIVRQQPPVPERRLMLQGELLRIFGDALLREIHQSRQHEAAVANLNAAAAAKDEFLAVLSHELRAPLAPIVGWASVMRKSETMEHVRLAAEAIERNALLQGRLVDDLLDTTRIAHGSMALDLGIHDLSELLRSAVETLGRDFEKKSVRLEFTGHPQPLPVRGDAGRLQQVFRNVVSNAVKFTPHGGSVTITVGSEANTVRVVVADSGAGIAPEFLPFVFEIFRQQEQGSVRKHDGLGIGLFLVKRITELHEGTVSVASAGVGQGTQVTLRFPSAPAQEPCRGGPAVEESPALAPGARLSDVAKAQPAERASHRARTLSLRVLRAGDSMLQSVPNRSRLAASGGETLEPGHGDLKGQP